MKKIIPISLLVIACLVSSSTVIARSTINVPMTDPVYRDLDRILGAGLVKDYIYGQRPFSREEVVRMLTEAQENLKIKKENLFVHNSTMDFLLDLEEITNRRLRQYQNPGNSQSNNNLYLRTLDNIILDLNLLDSPPRKIPTNNGAGFFINATVNPLVRYQEGRHYVDGETFALETQHWAQLSPYFSLFVHPRFALKIPNGRSSNGEVIIQKLYGKVALRNLEIQFGRDSLIWGQSPPGTLLFSSNARPLDMIKLTNSELFKFPWIFKHLGNFKGTFFFANLGPEHIYKNDFLAGFKISLQPHPLIELGLSSISNFGGQGAPDISFGTGVRDFFGWVPFGGISTTDDPISNRIAGVEVKFRIPPLSNLQLYLEMCLDDKTEVQVKQTFVDDAAYLAGIYLPKIFANSLDLRLEVRGAWVIFYRHNTFPDGYTLNNLLIGDPLGPDAWSIEVTSNLLLSPKTLLTFSFVEEVRDSDTYNRGSDGVSTVANHLPQERRTRLMSLWQHEWNDNWRSGIRFGYEKTTQFEFVPGNNINNFLGQLLLSYQFD